MNFTSLEFLFFFCLVFLVYWNLPDRWKKFFLILSSGFFYAFASWKFLFHLIVVVSINWFFIRFFLNKKWFLPVSIGFNVLNLAFFKYFYFFADLLGIFLGIPEFQNKISLDGILSKSLEWAGFEVVLPLTISYYTFQLISLLVDKKKGLIQEDLGFLKIASYIFLFPVMIAGPILRYSDVSTQFDSPKMEKEDMVDGLWLVVVGLFKKSVVTALMSGSIFQVFAETSSFSGQALLSTIYFFAIYLYLDFSGLTDLARGMGKLLGFTLPQNFKAPFFFNGFGDFWRRWHLTFSFWIRDYLYIPLGGSRSGTLRTCFNYLVAFGLGGLWHGANLNYLTWGALTGLYLSAERAFKDWNIKLIPEIPYVKRTITYLFVLHIYIVSWILFFTPDFSSAVAAVHRILVWAPGVNFPNMEPCIFAFFVALFFHCVEEWPERFKVDLRWKTILLPIVWILVLLALPTGNADFFYGQF
ncbi:MBOAT family protein [Leptospira selangorensis]|uniref:MBOAT family protein n=1 Tax=Leptospira selangorensis TaxID=2484982 RepID=A0A5F2C622_9LEPT|nr:MBOAT family O-acyltransferase [Leptospira selangorensis]TGM13843.1 MBOAT family protein [Leptospira selangorensis]TGM27224.1 MBOAT family protein [Leptospira selangorensis]